MGEVDQGTVWETQTPPEAYLEELSGLMKSMEKKAERVEEVVRHMLCGWEERWTAERLLKLGVWGSGQ